MISSISRRLSPMLDAVILVRWSGELPSVSAQRFHFPTPTSCKPCQKGQSQSSYYCVACRCPSSTQSTARHGICSVFDINPGGRSRIGWAPRSRGNRCRVNHKAWLIWSRPFHCGMFRFLLTRKRSSGLYHSTYGVLRISNYPGAARSRDTPQFSPITCNFTQ
jgi:hypothetical protein